MNDTATDQRKTLLARLRSRVGRVLRRLSGRPVGDVATIAEPAPHVAVSDERPSGNPVIDHAVNAYEALITRKLAEHPGNRELALAQSVGSLTMDIFRSQGEGHVQVLRHYGLEDGMFIYDLGAGCGRTAQGLVRSGWQGRYRGADIVSRLIDELNARCPGYEGLTHRRLSIVAEDASIDMVFHWSVFTHLFPEECFIYMRDIHRALKPGGRHVFSFLEMESPLHDRIFDGRVTAFGKRQPLDHLDTFLHRDWIRKWARQLGFSEPVFTDGDDARHHMPFWQSLAVMDKL